MSLKTLKDLRFDLDGDTDELYYPSCENGELVNATKLKEEAIKWVKTGLDFLSEEENGFRIRHIENKSISFIGLSPTGNEQEERMKGRIMGFIFFFNIIEEDLMTNEEINNREHGEVGNN